MTTYLETAHVAHVMEFRGDANWWPLCGRESARINFNEFWARNEYPLDRSPLRHTGYEPRRTKPWCAWCARRVAELAADVLGA